MRSMPRAAPSIGHEVKLGMAPVKLREKELRIVEFSATADEHLRSSSLLENSNLGFINEPLGSN